MAQDSAQMFLLIGIVFLVVIMVGYGMVQSNTEAFSGRMCPREDLRTYSAYDEGDFYSNNPWVYPVYQTSVTREYKKRRNRLF
jgi:hypothetical protein